MGLPRRVGWWLLTATACAVLLGVAWFEWSLYTWDPRGPDVKDPRACRGSNVSLAEAAGHFGLTVPADATDVHFSSDLHPFFGDYNLQVSFQTTAAGLRAFLATAGLVPPDADDSSDDWPSPLGPSCGFGPESLSAPRYCGDDPETSSKSFQRRVAVDRSDPARPRVVLSAMDL